MQVRYAWWLLLFFFWHFHGVPLTAKKSFFHWLFDFIFVLENKKEKPGHLGQASLFLCLSQNYFVFGSKLILFFCAIWIFGEPAFFHPLFLFK
ncbi:hypothetical protein [Clostridium minihomine]|uniref:hypothetical protein n=1 Tax=Clostridium minihomine TaxID=2045012 RepID=UPI0013EB65A2|nr:hypothetical protein [Clostridium minihomine]